VTLRFGFAAAAAAIGIAAGTGAEAATACLSKLAEVAVVMEGLAPIVEAKVDGQPLKLVLDTGNFYTMVSAQAAARSGMKVRDLPFGMNVNGIGGVADAHLGRATTFSFAGVDLPNRDIVVAGQPRRADGLIGEELMEPFDVEYDFAHGVIRFWRALGCGNQALAYWAAGASVSAVDIAARTGFENAISSTAQVDGKTIRVVFDTGAERSTLNRSAAAAAGLKLSAAGVVRAGASIGVDGRPVPTFQAPVASFKIGDEEMKNTQLMIFNGGREPQMLLGADFFLSHRVLVSSSQKKLYFTYNGGPVFALPPTAPPPQAVLKPPASAGQAFEMVEKAQAALARRDPAGARAALDAASQAPNNNASVAIQIADLYGRIDDYPRSIALFDAWTAAHPDEGSSLIARVGACRARGITGVELDKAAADCDAAINGGEAQPNAFVGRGLVRLRRGDLDGAVADASQALSLNPRTPWALYARGLAKLRKGDKVGGEADLAAAAAMIANIAEQATRYGLPKPAA
jgi:predicted aspartyl protease